MFLRAVLRLLQDIAHLVVVLEDEVGSSHMVLRNVPRRLRLRHKLQLRNLPFVRIKKRIRAEYVNHVQTQYKTLSESQYKGTDTT